MTIGRIVDCVNSNPKKLFQIDGYGAILSAILLGFVLVKLEHLIGIPKPTLFFLASLPCLFAVYDFYYYFNIIDNLGNDLMRIAIANLIYYCLSIGLVIYHKEQITRLGWIYILTEIVIVSGLALIELKTARNYMLNGSRKIINRGKIILQSTTMNNC